MSKVENILSKYVPENIEVDIITNGCLKLAINLKNGFKRIISLNEEESDYFMSLVG